MVDVVSSVGELPIQLDEWGAAIAVCGSSKSLGGLPGVGLTMASPIMRIDEKPIDTFAFSWDRVREAARKSPSNAHLTVSVPAIAIVNLRLEEMRQNGLEDFLRERKLVAELFNRVVTSRGLSSANTGAEGPIGVYRAPAQGARALKRMLTRHGLEVGSGQGPRKNDQIRFGWYGHGSECATGLEERLTEAGLF